MTDTLFLTAARRKFRFPSNSGLLTVEQLFDLPLTTTRSNGSSLDDTARKVNGNLKAAGEESFVALANPASSDLSLQLEIVKAVIAIKQAENADARARADRASKRAAILEALDSAERGELQAKSPAELRRMLAEME
jgi:hypothetical protein